jgi:hypothetical protein
MKQEVVLYDANGREFELVLTGELEPIVVDEPKEEVKEMTEEEKVLAEVERLQAELDALKKDEVAPSTKSNGGSNVKKNQKPGKADATRKYERLGEFKAWGKVPQQQADLAAIITESVDLGAEWTEEELFDLVSTGAKDYASLRNSKQDATYLFRYYRGLKNDGKHAGFIARNFLRMK